MPSDIYTNAVNKTVQTMLHAEAKKHAAVVVPDWCMTGHKINGFRIAVLPDGRPGYGWPDEEDVKDVEGCLNASMQAMMYVPAPCPTCGVREARLKAVKEELYKVRDQLICAQGKIDKTKQKVEEVMARA